MLASSLSSTLRRKIQQLKKTNERKKAAAFLVEGERALQLLWKNPRYTISLVIGTPSFLDKTATLQERRNYPIIEVTPQELNSIGNLKHNNQGLAVVKIPRLQELDIGELKKQRMLFLDGLQNPRNMGTLLRTVDWYGIHGVITSEKGVNQYHPQVVQASMGSVLNIPFYPVQRQPFFEAIENQKIPIIAATLKGTSLRKFCWPKHGLLLLGHETHGIHSDSQQWITQEVTIPRGDSGAAESLNVAAAAAVLCDYWSAAL